jgi:hypothetical protein
MHRFLNKDEGLHPASDFCSIIHHIFDHCSFNNQALGGPRGGFTVSKMQRLALARGARSHFKTSNFNIPPRLPPLLVIS